ncbi:MAG: SPOR domain-containing protein [Betaproteobacteria bacterium]|nr:SPOR domain-containing protein [Betaproteobacteria bacterium]NCP81270.1 SPOR domain-containing protein [Rhodoferax sp.]NCS59866.1 SPOR domain-containing protein [Rhodoferax sp.]PIZ21549.1 MAG: hypothetical protein COY49_13205 [Comamonadaceae bacterium CG_4_10_14_0_8_um_filter_57_29]PJC17911.1 MAG: hypothetical protein CO065_09190 [Comamonadaceae bacterium CG_4_9_14_0_8_um_filter_57_21]
MLRLWVLLLLLLNGVYFAWGQGWLMVYGFGPTTQREPQRLARQIQPEAVRTISEREAAQTLHAEQSAAPAKPKLCLLTPVLDEKQAQAVRAVLLPSWPTTSWTLEAATQTERWLVYMGKYTNPAELDKKRSQLDDIKIAYETLPNISPLAPGLSLGVFETQAKATTALATLVQRGVRTAKVLQERPALQGLRLRLPALDDSLLAQLPPVRAALGEQALAPCPAE